MLSQAGGAFIDVDRLDLRKYATRQTLAKVLCDYLLYHEHNAVKALELAAAATQFVGFTDWWWKARLGKCYYQLGLFRQAESQFKSALRHQDMVETTLELCKVYFRIDQPMTAAEHYMKALETHRENVNLLTGLARTYDMLGDSEKAVGFYRKVLGVDASSVEGIASLASYHFYTDQPEVSLKYYRRLLQMGVNTPELWNNLGLACFYASQYDMTLSCFERALNLASDDTIADIWYNVGQVAIGIGDLGLAFQAFKIAVSVNGNHAESFNNLGVLELRKSNVDQARSNFQTAQKMADFMFEPFFNGAFLAFKMGDFQESFELVSKALEAYPDHTDSKELLKQLKNHFSLL
jgi:tetratricopeptide repeat protein 8